MVVFSFLKKVANLYTNAIFNNDVDVMMTSEIRQEI